MRDKTIFEEKLELLGKLAELGGEAPIIDQTITKLLDYATDRQRKDLEDITAKLHTLEEQFGMTSDLFSPKFHRGALRMMRHFFGGIPWSTCSGVWRNGWPSSALMHRHDHAG